MRLFMNAGIYPSYARHFNSVYRNLKTYRERRSAYLEDRIGGAHFLGPVLDEKEWATFTIGDDAILQAMWACENGLGQTDDPDEILLAQIESHRAEVFYNLDPLRYGSSFLRKLPGCVKYKLCWRAAPSPGADFGAYDRVMCNFATILAKWEAQQWRTASFFPAHDPEMDAYATNRDRPVDVCFVGGFSRHHIRRTAVLDAVAGLCDQFDIRFFLDVSRFTKVAEHPLATLFPLGPYRRSTEIRSICRQAVFGRDYYELLGSTKIVLNGAIDMAGSERGNMRCFEAMGCGALLLSDEGSYPEGMENKETMLTYSSPAQAVEIVTEMLGGWFRGREISSYGHQMIKRRYSKEKQWQAFLKVIEGIS